MKQFAGWIMKIARKKSTVDQVASSREGMVFLRWVRDDVCKLDQDPMDTNGNPFITAHNIGRQAVWKEIQAELALDIQEVIDSAVAFEAEQENAEKALARLGISDQQGAAA